MTRPARLPVPESAWYRDRKLRVPSLLALPACPPDFVMFFIRLTLVTALALAWPGVVRSAAAQQMGNCKSSTQWTMEQVTKDHIKLTGQVEIQCGDQSFAADQIDLHQDTHALIAVGNVVFTDGGNRIAADRLEYNTETKTGTFFNAAGTATLQSQEKRRPGQPQQKSMFGTQEPDVYFYGDKISKIASEKYRITHGGFTTCVQPTPRWKLTSGTVLLNLEHYAVLTNSLFRVKSVPVFYLPVFYYPINKEDRATGFLIPTYGSSTIKGHTLSNAFFWAISRSQDATILYDWFSNTGQGIGGEYRYVASASSNGQIHVYNLREHQAEYTSSTGTVTTTPERTSYQIQGTMSQQLPHSFRARGRVDYFSDISVQQTYNQNVYNASQRQRSMSGSVSGVLGSWNLTGSYDRSEFFYGTTQSTLKGGTPRFSFQRSDKPLFGSPLYLSIGGEAATLLAQRKTSKATVDQGLSRFDVFPRIRFPFTKWPFLTISTSAAFRETFWTEQRNPKTGLNLQDPINRNYMDLTAQITGPIFSRIWTRSDSDYAEKLKHSIEPFFNVERVSAIDDFSRYVQLDGTDTIVGKVTRISYGVNNRFFRKPGGGANSRELMTVALGQSYYSDAKASQYDKNYQTAYGTAPSHLSPLTLQIRATPTDKMTGNFRAEYDTQFHALRTMTADGTVNVGDWLHASAGWSQRRYIEGLAGFNDPTRLDHYLNSSTTWKAWNNRVGGIYNFNYDILHGRFLQQRLMAYYNAQCCGLVMEYQQYNFTGVSSSPVPEDHRLNFTVTLAGIGTFSNIFGSFGGGNAGRY
jgi:LPS-assembly protein